jgi:hypothetical protein
VIVDILEMRGKKKKRNSEREMRDSIRRLKFWTDTHRRWLVGSASSHAKHTGWALQGAVKVVEAISSTFFLGRAM